MKREKMENRFIKSPAFYSLLLVAIVCYVLFATPAGAVYEGGDEEIQAQIVTGQIIIRFADGETPEELKAAAAVRAQRVRDSRALGIITNRLEDIKLKSEGKSIPEEALAKMAQVEGKFTISNKKQISNNLYLVESKTEFNSNNLVIAYEQLKNIVYAQPVYLYHILKTPDDQLYNQLWGMQNIKMEGAWDFTVGSETIIAAVIDAGIDPNHEDIKDNIVEFRDFAGCSSYRTGHGTHVAGTIGAVGNNSIGVAGVNWQVGLLGLNIDCDGENMPTPTIIQAIDYAIEKGARVVNLSLGGAGRDLAFEDAIARATQAGVIVVASAGNKPGMFADVFYPARDPNVITVSATGPDDKLATYSSYGKAVDVAAPGGNPKQDRDGDGRLASGDCIVSECILSTWPSSTSKYKDIAGTSMAAPHVAGLVALMLSANPGLSVSQLKQIIYDTADDLGESGRDDRFGYGRINAAAAVAAAAGNAREPTATPTPDGLTPTPCPEPYECESESSCPEEFRKPYRCFQRVCCDTAAITATLGQSTNTPTPTTEPPTATPTDIPITCSLTGDYNEDGSVDSADFTAWQTDYLAGEASLSCLEYWRRATSEFGDSGGPTATPTLTPTPTTAQDNLPDELVGVLDFTHSEPSWNNNDMRINTRIRSSDPWRIAAYSYIQPQVEGKSGIVVETTAGSIRCDGVGNTPGIGNCDSNGTIDTNPSGQTKDHIHQGASGQPSAPSDVFDQSEGYIIEVRIINTQSGENYLAYFGADKTPYADSDKALENSFSWR